MADLSETFTCCGWPMTHDENNGWSYWYCRACRRVVDVNPVPITTQPLTASGSSE